MIAATPQAITTKLMDSAKHMLRRGRDIHFKIYGGAIPHDRYFKIDGGTICTR